MPVLPPVIIAMAPTLPPSALSLLMKRNARNILRLIRRLKQDMEVIVDVVVVVVVVAMVVVATNKVNGAAPMTQPRLLKWESNALTMCG